MTKKRVCVRFSLIFVVTTFAISFLALQATATQSENDGQEGEQGIGATAAQLAGSTFVGSFQLPESSLTGSVTLTADDLTWADLGQVSPDGTGLGGLLGTWDGYIVGGVHTGQSDIFSYNINNGAYLHTAMPAATGAMAQGDGPLVYVATLQTFGAARLYSYDPYSNALTNLGLADAEYGQAVTVGLDGKVYVASCCAGKFSIYDPDTGSWDYRGRILTNYLRLSGLTTAADGTIYGTTARIWISPNGGAALYKYNPTTGQATVIDTIVPGLHEAWNVQYNPIDHRIYGSVSFQMVPRLWVYDPQQPALGVQDLGAIGSVSGDMIPDTMDISADGKIWAKVGPDLYKYDPARHEDGIVPVGTEVRGRITFGRDGRLYRVAYDHLYRTDAPLAPGSRREMCSSAAARQPILLLPGWGAEPNLADDHMAFAKLVQPLKDMGYQEGCNLFYAGEPVTSGYNSLPDDGLSIRAYLCSVAPQLKMDYPDWDGFFDIIGHSYGGLRARAYLENSKLYGSEAYPCLERDPVTGDRFEIGVNHLFTLGSPHGGGNPVLPGAAALGAIHLWQLQGESTKQLLPHNMASFNQNSQPDDVCYHLIGGNIYEQASLVPVLNTYISRLWLDGIGNVRPHDIGVYRSSALHLASLAKYPNVLTHGTEDLHGVLVLRKGPVNIDLSGYSSYFGPDPWDTFTNYIQPYLEKQFSSCQPPQSLSLQAAEADHSDETHLVPSILLASDLIDHGETQSGSFEVSEGGSSTFYLKWPVGELDYSLTDANGAVIDPITAETDPNVDYFEMEVMALTATYILTDTVSGTWSYSIIGADLSGETPYQLTMLPEAPVAVTIDASPWQTPGQTAEITATVTYSATIPLPDAVVTATIGRPDGTIDTLALLDDGLHNDGAFGDGIYGNGYAGTDLGGYYSAVAEAVGEYEGAGYLRTAETSFSITTQSVLLSGQYSDQPQDSDNDGLFEGIEVAAGVDVSQAGSYTVSGDLYASGGEHIGHAMVQADLALGTQDALLLFKGTDFLLSGLDGPYTLTNVIVLDSERGGMLLDEGTDIYATAAYSYLQFDTFDIDCISAAGESAVVTVPSDVDFSGNFHPLPGDQIAVFNSNGSICAGKGVWNGENLDVTVWGDDPATSELDGLLPGEQMQYRIWEAATGTEKTNLIAAYRQGNGNYASGSNHILDMLALASQEVPLIAGWNLISSHVSPGNNLIEPTLSSISDSIVLAKNGDGEVYWPAQDINQIVAWDIRDSYQVYVSEPSTLGITGTSVEGEAIQIDLHDGWNMISYLSNSPQAVADALESVGNRLALVKNGSGHVYWPEYDIDQIGDMQPGQGYKIYLNAPATLIYPPN